MKRGVAATLALLIVVALVFDRHYRFFDMAIYQGAVRWWLAGGDLYGYHAPVRGALGFTYPPFAAILLLPTALVPLKVAGWVITASSLLALAVTLRSKPLVFVAALAMEPVRQTLGLGQVNLLLLALVVLDLTVLPKRWRGVGVGIATAIKLTPGLFIVYLLVTRQWRAAGVAVATVTTLTAASLLVAPRESLRYFGDLMWHTARVGEADAVANQSLAGLLARLAGSHTAPTGAWLVCCAVALVAGLRRASQAHAYGEELTALALTGLTANLITPVAWTHHLVFLPLALLVLARSRDRLDVVAATLCYLLSVLSPIWWSDRASETFVLMAIFLVWRLPVAPRLPAVVAESAPSEPMTVGHR
ncbi:glycosyltransferase 87 family protein [Actinoplanes sp. NPDC089786]|uniref:glycosyltransferase 87 family protein n=1 Tax=Actinoplanes sp. NPDC089786 TaxID=3155185 RepID=UPI00343A7171